MMAEFRPGITGKIETLSVAYTIVRIAAGAMILLACARAFQGNYIGGAAVFIALFMASFNSRGAALALFLWMFVTTIWHILLTRSAFHQGAYLQLYLPDF